MKRIICFLLCILLTLTLPCAALCGCGGEPVTECAVTGVVYNPEKARMEVSCDFTDDILSAKTRRVYLFALPPDMPLTDGGADLTGLTPAAEANPKSHVTFCVPVGCGETDRLFASYTPAVYEKETDTYRLLCAPRSLPSAVRANDAEAAVNSVKGLAVSGMTDYDSDALRLGVSSVVIPVRLDRLAPAAWEEDAVPYLYDGTTRWLRGEVLDELDSRIDFFTRAGVRVCLRLTLGYDPAMPAPSCLYGSGVSLRAGGSYAVNIRGAEACGYVEGLITELVRRWAADDSLVGRGLCRDFIIGEAVNDSARWESGADVAQTAADYAALLRITDTALTLFAPAGGVYADLLVTQEERNAVTAYRDFLGRMAEAAAAKGDFRWNLSARVESDTTAIWSGGSSFVRDMLYYPLGLLTDGNSDLQTASDGTRRRLAVTLTVPGSDEVGQAASYAWAYLSMTASSRVETLFWGDHVSSDSTALCALRADSSTDRREVYTMLAVADTNCAESRFAVARQVVGQPFAEAEARLRDGTPPVTRTDTAASLAEALPRGTVPLIAFDDGTVPFADAGLLTHTELARVDGNILLASSFDRVRRGAPAGISTVLSPGALDGVTALYLPMTVYTSDASPATVTVTLTMPASGDANRDGGRVIYTATQTGVASGTAFILSCDTGTLSGTWNRDDTCVLSVTIEPESDTPAACRLLSEPIRMSGGTHGLSPAALAGIWIAVGVLTAAVVFAVLFFRSKRRKGRY